MKRIVVLISGSGSNLQTLIDVCRAGRLNAEIVAVISNKPDALGLQRAAEAGIAQHCLLTSEYDGRLAFDHALQQQIDQYQPDLVVLAGYMRILSAPFVSHYLGRLLNIHPSLLPKYPGLHTHRKALEQGDQQHGASVHFVTEQLDGGPVILQGVVPVYQDDSEQSLAARVLTIEHQLYPQVVRWWVDGRLQLHEGRAYLDEAELPASGVLFQSQS